MKIAYVYDAVYPWETGGVQKRVWELSRRLARDHDIHWYGLKYWDGPDTIQRDGVTLHGVMNARELYVGDRRSIREALTYAAKLVRPLVSDSFDVVDCQEFPYFPSLSSKIGTIGGRASFVLTWHEVWGEYWYEYLGWKGVFGKSVERLTTVLPDVHVAVSDQTRNQIHEIGVPNVTLVPNGISFDEFEAVRPSNTPVDVLYVGRFIKEKRPELVVDAVAGLVDDRPDLRCMMIGQGPRRATVEQAVTDYGLEANVTILDPLDSYDEVIGFMKAADALALPSRREGFGITALESLAVGTPVVTTAHPRNAVEDLITHGETGAVVDASPESFAEGIRLAWSSTSSKNCIESAEPYDWDRIASRTEQVYEEAVGERGDDRSASKPRFRRRIKHKA